jgi:hypothetical protein
MPGITTPHGDHSPHHGGIVMMNGEMHYEVVFRSGGQASRLVQQRGPRRLPASIATGVTMVISRPMGPAETLPFRIDDSGESWVAAGRRSTRAARWSS